ncbi:MAG: hypothetical protein EA412_04560 [Chitinophagaceae bacterium]|nr:MAG: hypothetical protein EA412_04560 [Chitinophagaceae bacterium]
MCLTKFYILFNLFILLSFINPLKANINIDSLLSIWDDETLSDTVRLNALKTVAWDGLAFKNADSAYILANKLLDYSTEKNVIRYQADALITLGVLSSFKGDNTKALDYYYRAYALNKEHDRKRGMSSNLLNIGNIYLDQGNSIKALENFYSALRINEELGDKGGIATNLINIANIHTEQGDYDAAMKFYRQAKEINSEIKNFRGIVISYYFIGDLFKKMGDYENALKNFYESLSISKAEKLDDAIAANSEKLGSLYLKDGNYIQAEKYYKEALLRYTNVSMKSGIAKAFNSLSNLFIHTGDLPSALRYAKKSMDIALEIENVESLRNASQSLSAVYHKMAQYKDAFEMHLLFIEMRDSIANIENQREAIRMNVEHEYDKKKALIESEQEKREALVFEEMRRKNFQIIASLTGLSMTILLAGLFFVQRNKITKERNRSEDLLLNILPAETANELKEKGYAVAKQYNQVTVLFTDFIGFTKVSEQLKPHQLVEIVNECFSAFDRIMEKYEIEKIKTVGDAYMAAGGMHGNIENHAVNMINAAIEIQLFLNQFNIKQEIKGNQPLKARVGLHTGAVVAGIVGIKKFQYDIWGDTVNTAARMESNGETGKVNISETTYKLIKEHFNCEYRGEIEVKGKGKVAMYFVNKKDDA